MKYVLLVLLLAGCGDAVMGNAIHKAVEGCKEHGGVMKIYNDLTVQHAICLDGTRVMGVTK